ncbi:uridine-cytidine kinase-like 1 [Oscarella lobularis]|uniref:uridine-cytidine kinase-like 1 n=1 Tax=Oscarella lobularis TaxID=121494 RepID=UPI003313A6EA
MATDKERQRKLLFTAGRPPWYDSQGQSKEPFLIGIGGGSASGKTTVAQRIINSLKVQWVVLLSMDSFYKVLSPEELEKAERSEYDFDHPDAFDFDLLIDTLKKLKEGKNVQIPIYDFTTHKRTKIPVREKSACI